MALRVKISARAGSQIRQVASWWGENRTKASGAVREDVNEALALLTHQPLLGSPCADMPDLRRLLLGRLRYFLYYRVTPDAVEILAFWHASRGKPPQI
jgi:plasmid stabilization system protein ParE